MERYISRAQTGRDAPTCTMYAKDPQAKIDAHADLIIRALIIPFIHERMHAYHIHISGKRANQINEFVKV